MSRNVGDWYRIGADMFARDLWTKVPLDWSTPDGQQIDVFAREIVDESKLGPDLDAVPALVYLEGGPGGKGQRPTYRTPFIEAALKRFRLVMPDQRGTGRSAPVQEAEFEELSAEEAAKRLSHLRSDSIVRDFEAIRKVHFGGRPWWSLGHSYGGFMTLNYLSHAPEGLVASAITGGLPNIHPNPVEVYERTFPRVRAKNKQFFTQFTYLQARVDKIADILQRDDVRLPNGDRLTVRRLQTLGFDFGTGRGFDRVHWLLDEAFSDRAETTLSQAFLVAIQHATDWAAEPLYIALQEAIYGPGPTTWGAQQVREQQSDFDESARPVQFTGEMAFPWMFEEMKGLAGFSAGVHALTQGHWPIELYNAEKLRDNQVPVEAAVYFDDMYVDAALSLNTARSVGSLHAWVTNEFEHDGLDEGAVAERLFAELERRVALKSVS